MKETPDGFYIGLGVSPVEPNSEVYARIYNTEPPQPPDLPVVPPNTTAKTAVEVAKLILNVLIFALLAMPYFYWMDPGRQTQPLLPQYSLAALLASVTLMIAMVTKSVLDIFLRRISFMRVALDFVAVVIVSALLMYLLDMQ